MIIFVLLSLILTIPAHIIGIFYAAAKSGFLAGVDRFENFGINK